MGVSGLWDILASAGKSLSLVKLAVDAFERNDSDKRAYRVGIDASIWYKHATFSKEGENPELRLLFFRVKDLARLPLLPLFVFDGRCRPKVKRGSRMGKSGSHNLTKNMKMLLDVFGIEWREAEGEAEAELAYLNRVGVIDAIMTDDVDAFLFGAITIIRKRVQSYQAAIILCVKSLVRYSPSMALTGNKANPALNLEGKPSKHHVMEFKIEDIETHPEIGMTQGGMILFALLTGGDYDKGVDKIGKATAYALARCGFGDELYIAALNREEVALHNFLPAWRQRINTELRENREGYLKRVYPGLCLPDTFPNLELLDKYVRPARREGGISGIWKNKELSLPRAAGFCEKFFEWGTRTSIIKRFRTLLWEASVIHILRRAALEQDKREADKMSNSGMPFRGIRHCRRPDSRDAIGTSISLISRYLSPDKVDHVADRISAAFVNKGASTPDRLLTPDDPKSFIVRIHSDRRHTSTDRSLEYRIEVDPAAFVELTQSGIKSTRLDKVSERSSRDMDVDDGAEESYDEGNSSNRRKSKPAKAPLDPLSTFRMWCPAPMLWRVAPQLIEEYELVQEVRKDKKTRRTSDTRRTSNAKGKRKSKAARLTISSDTETEASADDDGYRSSPSPQKKIRTASTTLAPDNTVNNASVRLGCRSEGPSSSPIRAFRDASQQHVDKHMGVSMMSHQSPRTVFQVSHSSGDNWDANDTSSLFLFSIRDPCDPDLINRADLHPQAPEPVPRWTDLSYRKQHSYDEDDEFNSGDDELDLSFQRSFLRNAQKSNKAYALSAKDGTVNSKSSRRNARAIDRTASISSIAQRKVEAASTLPTVSKIQRQGHPPSPSNVMVADSLFLPSWSSIPAHYEHSSSRARSSSSKLATGGSDVIDLNSSDEECDFRYSSFSPPSSLLSSSSPTGRLSQGRRKRCEGGQFAK